MSEDERQQPRLDARGGEPNATIARNAFYLVVGQAATMALGMVLSAVLGRFLGAGDFGIYYLITAMANFAYVMVEWGQPVVVIRQIAREPLHAGDLLGTALAMRVAFAFVVIVPAGLVAWALGYPAHTIWLLVLMLVAFLPLFLAQGYGLVFRAREQMGRDATVTVSNKALVLCLTLPVLVLGGGLRGVILAQATAGVLALVVAGRLYGRLGAPSLRVSSTTARDLFATGAPILAMTAAISAQAYMDAIILSKLAPSAVVGWFGAAKTIIGTLMAPAAILGAAAFPRLARASANPVTLRQEVRSALRPLLWLGALAGTGTYLFAGAAIDLIYGSRGFGPAATILQVFAPGLFLIFIDILLGNIIYASGPGTAFAVAKVASVVVGTVLDLVLIPLFQTRFGNGGIGVVVAFALSEFVVFAGALIGLRRGTFEPAAALDVARALGAAAATILLFRWLPSLPPWAGIPLCVAAFAAAAAALGLMRRRDLIVLGALVRPQKLEAGQSRKADS